MKRFKKLILAIVAALLVQVFVPLTSVSADQQSVDSSKSIDSTVPYLARDQMGLGSGGVGFGRLGGIAALCQTT
ncbi:hypothetical protein FC52_GL001629 [Lactobacillus pasteurii DSM 23907 = CRBIP 24.76]|uniref:Uncharacterized protein n=1 Tax=Lactobacillus pasteurii DSM 23907 = CRBIP 24.76 TaxID=1423790 RepID=I7LD57_9LACO|nr:hypothetical protein [Lactobacillus pasteurii]KRK07599.1 hypothetical protein FC52_GL001629 [Lactobacillus pasteurii DSM 23907 = CRBIP 24.76]TDG77116.1 hypothetical protein C5L33_000309 [Lactobacillus pasteurii]CCI84598.1 Protein of unknown function [Lactobacillus pasteurii DSM 23907 = CRBIP 24.76]